MTKKNNDDEPIDFPGLPKGMVEIIAGKIPLGKKRITIAEHLGIKKEKFDEISREVFGVVFTHCCDGEDKIVRKLFPEVKDTEQLAKLILFGKAMGRLSNEEGHI